MIQPYEILYFDETFIKPPKRGKIYSTAEFEMYLGMIGGIRENTSRNFQDLVTLATELDKNLNEKLSDFRMKSIVKELFFSYRGYVNRYTHFNSRNLSQRETWTYENLIQVNRLTLRDLTKELNAHVDIANDPILFTTLDPQTFIDRFDELKVEFRILQNPDKWQMYFEDRFLGSPLMVQYQILTRYNAEFRPKPGESISSSDLVKALLRKQIRFQDFEDIQSRNLEYITQKELLRFQGDREALSRYVGQLYEKFEVKKWKLTYTNIGKAMDTKIEYGDLKYVFLKGISSGLSLKGETIEPILARYRLNLSLDEQQIRQYIQRMKSSSTSYEFIKPIRWIEEKTLAQLHFYQKNQSNSSKAQAQRIRILKLKYAYETKY